jgi:hypothetical protein
MFVTEPLSGAAPTQGLAFEMTLNSSFHSSYHELPIVNSFLRQLVATWPDTANLLHLGYSGEGREMLGIRVARRDRKKKDRPKRKRTIVIQGAQHAREVCTLPIRLRIEYLKLVAVDCERNCSLCCTRTSSSERGGRLYAQIVG